MKQTLALFLFAITACTKPTSSVSPAMNSTESQLVGTWYVDKQMGWPANPDTVFTGYDATHHFQFSSSQYGSTSTGAQANWKQATDATPSLTSGFVLSPTLTNTSIPTYWYYDAGTTTLTILTTTFSITTLTSTNLVLKRVTSGGTYYTYLHK